MNIFLRTRLKLEREAHRLAFRGQILTLEQTLRQSHSLAVPALRTISLGSRIHNRFLADALAKEELGTWALDTQTVDFFEQEIHARRPQAVLEFGTGISTICFARFMMEAGNTRQPCVFSIEQNAWQVEKSQQQLAALGLDTAVRILYAPLKPQSIEGVETVCYDLPEAQMREFFAEARPDFIVVDGLSGDGTVRFGILPLIRADAASEAVFFLDDAFRPEELDVAERWNSLSYLVPGGIRKTGKGILTGQLCAS